MASTDTMLQPTRTAPLAPVRWIGIYLELAKARLTALVLATAAVGYLLAADTPVAWTPLLWTLLGTALTAGGANGLNQCYEADADSRMTRTRARPIVSRRISLGHAWNVSALAIALGAFLLSAAVNTLAASLAAGTALLYVFLYTPLKFRTSACTLVGAAVGALPPLIGAAATGSLPLSAWILAAILFIWQVPHSLALAWLYSDDYAHGGYRLLVWADRALTLDMIMLYCLALLPVSLTFSLAHLASGWYALGAIALGLALQVIALQLHRARSKFRARRLFVATIIYLPLLMGLLLADHYLAA
jgi:protoheme IX farnesyltransferase